MVRERQVGPLTRLRKKFKKLDIAQGQESVTNSAWENTRKRIAKLTGQSIENITNEDIQAARSSGGLLHIEEEHDQDS